MIGPEKIAHRFVEDVQRIEDARLIAVHGRDPPMFCGMQTGVVREAASAQLCGYRSFKRPFSRFIAVLADR